MALADAVRSIVSRMKEDFQRVDRGTHEMAVTYISGYIAALEAAFEAAEGSTSAPVIPSGASPELFHRSQIEKAKEERRVLAGGAAREDAGLRSVECVGGEADQCFTTVPGDMPTGAKTRVG